MKTNKRLFTFFKQLVVLILIQVGHSGCRQESAAQNNNFALCDASNMVVDGSGLSQLKAIFKTPNGNVTFKFYPQKAPNTVTRICDLINQGFYQGQIFHRVIPNFVAQTGDPTASGQGGSGKNLLAEFNDIGHIIGTVAMARRENDPNSADSQFYFALARLHHLDGKYTVFGQVVEGLEVLPMIRQGDQIISTSLAE